MIDDGFNTHFFMFGKESEHLSAQADPEKEKDCKANVEREAQLIIL